MTDEKRRKFLQQTGYIAAFVPLTALFSSRQVIAADTPMVDESSAQAKALQYVAESSVEGRYCNNCALYQGDENSEAGACGIFPGKNVAAKGWCSAWVPKA